MRRALFYLYLLLIVPLAAIFSACTDGKDEARLEKREYTLDEQLSFLAPEGDSAYWIGGEWGSLWRYDNVWWQHYHLGTERLYVAALERKESEDEQIIWLGVRNSGLQLWRLNAKTNEGRRLKTFSIPGKGELFSAYDVVLTADKVFVATSQGLFYKERNDTDPLKPLYPENIPYHRGKALVAKDLSWDGKNTIAVATQNGLMLTHITSPRPKIFHEGESILHVYAYDGHFYSLAENRLYEDDSQGTSVAVTSLDFTARGYFQAGGVHYFVGSTNLVLSEDLQDFVFHPLEAHVPDDAHKFSLFSPSTNFAFLLTDMSLLKIPYHSKVFSQTPAIVSSCNDNKSTYYLSAENELYFQASPQEKAKRIYSFSPSVTMSLIGATNGTLYYLSERQTVKKISLTDSYLENQIFASEEEIYTTNSKVTRALLKARSTTPPRLLLGVQDGLVAVDETGRTDTLEAFSRCYITSFYAPAQSPNIYLSTMNNGLYYGTDFKYDLIPGTAHQVNVRDMFVSGDYRSSIVTLTGHSLILNHPKDSLEVKGLHRLLPGNDTIFYALSEQGISKFIIGDGRIRPAGTFYKDIHFHPQASYVLDGKMYLASSLGVLTFNVDEETRPQWLEFNEKVLFSLQNVGIALLVVLLSVSVILWYVYGRRALGERNFRNRLRQIRHRIERVIQLYDFDKETQGVIGDSLLREYHAAERSPQTEQRRDEQLAVINDMIIHHSQDVGLHSLAFLHRQTERIAALPCADQNAMLDASRNALSANNLEQISTQIGRNEKWLKAQEEIGEKCRRFEADAKGILSLKGVSDDFLLRLANFSEVRQQLPTEELLRHLAELEDSHGKMLSVESETLVARYLKEAEDYLQEGAAFDDVQAALLAEASAFRDGIGDRPMLELLRKLSSFEHRLSVVRIKNQLAAQMERYAALVHEFHAANERRRLPKSEAELQQEIAEATADIRPRIETLINRLYERLYRTDGVVLNEMLELNGAVNQQTRVLALLIAQPRVRRTNVPGMLGLYSNLNPVISRLVSGKIKVCEPQLRAYCTAHPSSPALYILRLAE